MHATIPATMKVVYLLRHFTGSERVAEHFEASSRRKALLKLADSDGGTLPVPRIHVSSVHESFFRDKRNLRAPFVLTGVHSGPVLDWEDLSRECGSTKVPLNPAPLSGRQWQSSVLQDSCLSDAMRDMSAGSHGSVIGSSNLFVSHPHLLQKVQRTRIESLFGKTSFRQEAFIGGVGATSSFHCAAAANVYLMALGRKRWTLVDPRDSFAMYPCIGRTTKSSILGSPIDTRTYCADQHSRFPMYDKVRKWQVELDPGDLLFVPSFWWHEVTNLERSIGVPMRVLHGAIWSFLFLLSALSRFGLKYMPRAILTSYSRGRIRWDFTDSVIHESFGNDAAPTPSPFTSGGRRRDPKSGEDRNA